MQLNVNLEMHFLFVLSCWFWVRLGKVKLLVRKYDMVTLFLEK